MRRTLQRALMAAALSVTAIAGSLVAAGPASAQPANPGCPDHFICLYADVNFNHWNPESAKWELWHEDIFHGCNWLDVGLDGWITSVYNNTDAHLRLWDNSAHPDYLVGTASRRKGYTYLGARGNDATDTIHAIGCR